MSNVTQDATIVDIKMIKGDTFECTLSVTGYTVKSTDEITITIRNKYDDVNALFTTTISPSNMMIKVPSSATKDFPRHKSGDVYGEYVYDIQLSYIADDLTRTVRTLVRGKFILLSEVSY